MADDMKDSASYELGYGRPPKQTRFQPGKSGNPKGRPKGSKNLATIVLREARKPVRVNGPGGVRTVTKAEATVLQLANQSVQGDLAAQRQFLPLIRDSEDSLSRDNGAAGSPHERDQVVMQSILQRIRDYKPLEETTASEPARGGDE